MLATSQINSKQLLLQYIDKKLVDLQTEYDLLKSIKEEDGADLPLMLIIQITMNSIVYWKMHQNFISNLPLHEVELMLRSVNPLNYLIKKIVDETC